MRYDEQKPIVHRKGRTIYFFDEIDNASVCEAIKLIHELEQEKNKPIELIIDSIGGYCYDGLALYDKLRSSPCEIVTTGTGLIASMAVVIFLAGDTRYLTENASIMTHQAGAEIEGRVSDVRVEAAELKRLDDITLEIIVERTGQSIKKVRADIKETAKYLSAEQGIEEGFADKVVANKKTKRRRRKTA